MNRIDINQQIRNLIFFLIIQIPFLYKFVLFNTAFGFFYIGFVLLLPLSLPAGIAMAAGFFAGLVVDVFSSTPGIHASACVLIGFIRVFWFTSSVDDDLDENQNVSWNNLGLWGAFKYFTPLIFIHLLVVFLVENGGFYSGMFSRVFYSTVYTSVLVMAISILIAPSKRRL